MRNITTLFAAAAFAWCGNALAADEPGGADAAPAESQSTAPESPGQPPEGFVVLQRNIYVPVDNQGKVLSSEWVVVERQGYVTTEELKEITREHAKGGAAPEAPAELGTVPKFRAAKSWDSPRLLAFDQRA